MGRDSYELGSGFAWTDHVRAPGRIAYEDYLKVVLLRFPGDIRTELNIPRVSYRSACPLAWSPDAATLFQSFKGQVDAIDIATGKRRTVTAFAGGIRRSSVLWQLCCSPDGRRLLFVQVERPTRASEGAPRRGTRIFSAATDGSEVCEVCAGGKFACSWGHDLLVVGMGGSQPGVWRMDLMGRNARRVLEGALGCVPTPSELQIAPDGERAVYHLDGAVWSLDLSSGEARKIVDQGKMPALSPNGESLAFQRSEHDLYVQRIGGPPECVLEGRGNDETSRGFGWSQKPIWSPDGRLLLFRTTLGKRHAEPVHPEFVAQMRKEKAAAERRRTKGAKPRRHADYDGSIEHDHWEFQHSVGIVDFETREVWMAEGHWSYAAWGPVP